MANDTSHAVIVELQQQQPPVPTDLGRRQIVLTAANQYETTIGRASSSNTHYEASPTSGFFAVNSVSREHAKLVYQNGSLCYLDTGSRNGSKVNGTVALPSVPVPLFENDEIVLAVNKTGFEPLVLKLLTIKNTSQVDRVPVPAARDETPNEEDETNSSNETVDHASPARGSETEHSAHSRKRKRGDDDGEGDEEEEEEDKADKSDNEADNDKSDNADNDKALRVLDGRPLKKARRSKRPPRNWLSILGTLTTGAVIGGVATFAALASSAT